MTEVTQAVSTDGMRAEADQLMASVREDNRSLFERQRRAAQLTYEAGLIDDAAAAKAELDGANGRVPRLEQARIDAVAAHRAAEDRRDEDLRHRDQRRAEEQKAEDDDAPAESQEEAAIRVRKAERRVELSEKALAAAGQARGLAENELATWKAHVAELEREHGALDRKAENPGIAPNLPGIAPGVLKLSDMDHETRAALALVVTTLASQSLSSSSQSAAAPGRNRRTTLGELAQQDPTGYRYVRTGVGVNVIPPDWRGSGR
jgi:hypothetical protein